MMRVMLACSLWLLAVFLTSGMTLSWTCPVSLSVHYIDPDLSSSYIINLRRSRSQSADFKVRLGNGKSPDGNTDLYTYLGSVKGDSGGGWASAVYERASSGSGLASHAAMYIDLVLGNGRETVLTYDLNTKKTHTLYTRTCAGCAIDWQHGQFFWETLPGLDAGIDGIYSAKISYDIGNKAFQAAYNNSVKNAILWTTFSHTALRALYLHETGLDLKVKTIRIRDDKTLDPWKDFKKGSSSDDFMKILRKNWKYGSTQDPQQLIAIEHISCRGYSYAAINGAYSCNMTDSPVIKDKMFYFTLRHELGHNLGLDHYQSDNMLKTPNSGNQLAKLGAPEKRIVINTIKNNKSRFTRQNSWFKDIDFAPTATESFLNKTFASSQSQDFSPITNDFSVNGHTIILNSVGAPHVSGADVYLKDNQTFTYTPAPVSKNPIDWVTYQIKDSSNGLTAKSIAVIDLIPQLTGFGSNKGKLNIPGYLQSDVHAIAAGENHLLAVDEWGNTHAWGSNTYGQIDIPDSAKSNVSKVAAGPWSSMALTRAGKIVTWGFMKNAIIPPGARGNNIKTIASGFAHELALTRQGDVYVWGDKNTVPEILNIPDNARHHVKAIVAGFGYSLALTDKGQVVFWGLDQFGLSKIPDEAQKNVIAISAGMAHALALTHDGKVIAWGDNSKGQIEVPDTAQKNVIAISAGYDHSLALKKSHQVVAWGDNSKGQTTVPHNLSPAVDFILAGNALSLALRTRSLLSGVVFAGHQYMDHNISFRKIGHEKPLDVKSNNTGSVIAVVNSKGELVTWGIPASSNGLLSVPDKLKSSVKQVSMGKDFGLALMQGGSVSAWGSQARAMNDHIPAGLASPGAGVIQVSASDPFFAAVKQNGDAVVWFRTAALKDKSNAIMPSADKLKNVKQISLNNPMMLVLHNDGTLSAWSWDPRVPASSYAFLKGMPDDAKSGIDTFVISKTSAKNIDYKYYTALVKKTDGTFVGWGNYYDVDYIHTYQYRISADSSIKKMFAIGQYLTSPSDYRTTGSPVALMLDDKGQLLTWNSKGKKITSLLAGDGIVSVSCLGAWSYSWFGCIAFREDKPY